MIFKKDPFARGLAVVGCLGIFNKKMIPISLVKKLFPEEDFDDNEIFSAEKLKELFLHKLTQLHYVNGILDLHNLDHDSARMLVAALVTSTNFPTKIICGASNHSKAANIGIMFNIVKEHIEKTGLTGYWQPNNGGVTLTKVSSSRILNSTAAKQFSTLNPLKEKITSNEPVSLNPNAKEFIPGRPFSLIQKKRN
jgi:hypothetical protein